MGILKLDTEYGSSAASDTTLGEGTEVDYYDMKRMGKKQELSRRYGFTSLVGYAVLLAVTWPSAIISVPYSISNGGRAAAIWTFIGVCITMLTVVLSVAEMASVEPASGGQFHWVSAFAPKRLRRPASYISGLLTLVAWMTIVPRPAYVAATSLQSIALLTHKTYNPHTWHTVLMTICIILLAGLFNSTLARRGPLVQVVGLGLYTAAFVAVLIALLVLGDKTSSHDAFARFEDANGWGSFGTACFVGAQVPVLILTGSDAAAHLAEETRGAARTVPRAIVFSAVINYVLGFGMLVAVMFVLGDVDAVLQTAAALRQQPWVRVVLDATGNVAGTVVVVAIVVILCVLATVNMTLVASRMLFAFARDGGMPFDGIVSKVNQRTHIPIMAVLLTTAIGSALSVIPLGSVTAFVGVQSIGTTGLLASYILSIASRLYSRCSKNTSSDYRNISNPPTPDGPNSPQLASPFRLSRMFGSAINVVALASLSTFLTTASFPLKPRPQIQSSSMNWGSISWGGVMIVAVVGYFFCRNRYLLDGRSVPTRQSVVPEKAPVLDMKIPDGKFSNNGSLLNL